MNYPSPCDVWCNFVLSEGIMPAPIVRKLKNPTDNGELREKDYRKIAAILMENRRFRSAEDADIARLAATAFGADAEIVDWLEKTKSLLAIIKDYAPAQENSMIDMSDIAHGAMSSFVKSCPYATAECRQNYVQQISGPRQPLATQGLRIGYGPTQESVKDAFVEYLRQRGYGDTTAASYKSSINTIGKLCEEAGIELAGGKGIWAVQNPSEIAKVQNILRNDYNFSKKVKSGHTMLSNGLNRFYEFLRDTKVFKE